MKTKLKIRLQKSLGLTMLMAALIGCSRENAKDTSIATARDLVGRTCAVVVGSMMGDMTLQVQPGIGIEWFNDYNSGVEAVRLNKVAAMPLDFFYARRWARKDPATFAVTKPYASIPWGFLFAKGNPLRTRVDEVLSKMRASGELDRILKRWSEAEEPEKLALEELTYRRDFTGRAGTLRFATPGDREPVSFVRADGIVGFDIEIARRIAYELDMKLELVQVSMGALVTAVQRGKADMGGGGIAITRVRAEQVDFSACYYRVPTVFLIRRTSAASAERSIRSAADLKGKRCAVVLGTVLQEITEKLQSGISFMSYNDAPSALEAVRLGKVDFMSIDTVIGRQWVSHRPDDFVLALSFSENPYGYFFPKGSPLRTQVNDVLARLKARGEIKRLVSKWCDAQDLGAVSAEKWSSRKDFTGSAGVLRFATSGDFEPGAFARNGTVVGFDIDLAACIAHELNMRFEIVQVNMPSLVPAVQSRKADMGGGCITITQERSAKVDFSDCYLDEGFSVLTRKAADGKPRTICSAEQLKGCHVAHMSSDFHRQTLRKLQPDIVYEPYSEYAYAVESLRNGKIDAISLGRSYAALWQAKFPGEFAVAFDYADDVCCFLLPKGSPLRASVNAELRKLNASGESEKIVRKWMDAAKSGKPAALPRFPPPPPGAPELVVASAAQSEPWCYVAEEGVVGIDIEILTILAHRLGRVFKPKLFSWGGMVDCVNAGRCDIANGGIYTAGWTFPTVEASEKYADERMCLLVRDASFVRKESGLLSIARSFKDSFVRTFVVENRWRMMANGLGLTLFITFLSAIFGTVLAFPVWWARTSSCGFVSQCARGYIAALQGTPILVLLMVLFYIVFGKVDLDGVWVAIIGFSLNASAYIGEMLRSGIDSVPRGQTEAALALGYSSRRAFCNFVLPQAVRAILPVYRGEIIGLLKSTSIVGYIAINDLTKASDLVRSRTYESFFPILTTAFIYFVAAWLLALALDRFGRRLDPANRREAQ